MKILRGLLLAALLYALPAHADDLFNLTATFSHGCDPSTCFWSDNWQIAQYSLDTLSPPGTYNAIPDITWDVYGTSTQVGPLPLPAGYPDETTIWQLSETYRDPAFFTCPQGESGWACATSLFGIQMDQTNSAVTTTLPFWEQGQEDYQAVLASDPPAAVPEPSSLGLLMVGLLGLVGLKIREPRDCSPGSMA